MGKYDFTFLILIKSYESLIPFLATLRTLREVITFEVVH